MNKTVYIAVFGCALAVLMAVGTTPTLAQGYTQGYMSIRPELVVPGTQGFGFGGYGGGGQFSQSFVDRGVTYDGSNYGVSAGSGAGWGQAAGAGRGSRGAKRSFHRGSFYGGCYYGGCCGYY